MALAAVRDLPMFSPVQGVIFAADAGLKEISAATIDIAVIDSFIAFLPRCSTMLRHDSNQEKWQKFREP
jgi:hypothetical protein